MSYQVWQVRSDAVTRVGLPVDDKGEAWKLVRRTGPGSCITLAEQGGVLGFHNNTSDRDRKRLERALSNGKRPDGRNVPAADIPPPGKVPAVANLRRAEPKEDDDEAPEASAPAEVDPTPDLTWTPAAPPEVPPVPQPAPTPGPVVPVEAPAAPPVETKAEPPAPEVTTMDTDETTEHTCAAQDCVNSLGRVRSNTNPDVRDLCPIHRKAACDRARIKGVPLAEEAARIRSGAAASIAPRRATKSPKARAAKPSARAPARVKAPLAAAPAAPVEVTGVAQLVQRALTCVEAVGGIERLEGLVNWAVDFAASAG